LGRFDNAGYACDLYETQQTISSRRLRGLAAMDWQAERFLQALSSGGGWADLMREFPELRQVCVGLTTLTGESAEAVQDRLVRMYMRHVQEWKAFPPRQLLLTQRKAA
jgi:hypothetical protein